MNPKRVVAGWGNAGLASVNLLQREKSIEATRRLNICKSNTCGLLVDGICKKDLGGCGCPVNKKVFSMEDECPKGLWGKYNI